ncbi:MAG: single-stranded DNA-binding protein [Corynebacterium sp.]|uniref:single-stranded DNA-binding protein n=1 Tax=Corynebacterium sp. TaxID=1720 RepID=UPI0026DC04B9|nr:single-stranded DNA-binding protein [Corynebacterium sp.]MDO5098772.1 single-stranded DNA-binding protein [Corynebacterium sp.]
MAQGDVNITIVGNVVADPELRFTQTGAAVATFRVASTPRRYDSQSGQWVDGEAMFLSCNIWRQAAENVAETLTKGMRVIVTGRLRQRSYESREGEKRTVMELEVEEVGPSLRYATAQVNRNPREGGYQGGGSGNFGGGNAGGNFGGNSGGFNNSQGGFGGGQPANQGGFGGGQQQSAPANDPWSSAPPAGGFGGADDEPPF